MFDALGAHGRGFLAVAHTFGSSRIETNRLARHSETQDRGKVPMAILERRTEGITNATRTASDADLHDLA